MKKNRKYLKILIFVVISTICFSLFGCFEDDEKDPIKVIITCSSSVDAGFTGSYTLNSNSAVGFSSSVATTNMEIYQVEFDDVDELTIFADKDDQTSVLSIQIFKDNKYIKSLSASSGTDQITLEFDYNDYD
jgi:hypothetical protein